ncbi:hypothetical protein K431DRAFT_282118 [Polychaeton citri CBS 116435]|uniref:Uncharacterized protein n=1 Tax=Polychaeton citri CBS 116435 TaxID=1314669 RepID=A0A9P4UT12_9PEZI|nr:hypothetical protein K431DRAFT_282118 [Polychaeton citri CBS 116435]
MLIPQALSDIAELILLPILIILVAKILAMALTPHHGLARRRPPHQQQNHDQNRQGPLPGQSPNPNWTGGMSLPSSRAVNPPTTGSASSQSEHSQPDQPEDVQAQLHRIYHVAFLLRQKLVPDVVPQILDTAGFYVAQTCARELPQPFTVVQHASPRQVLETPPVTCSVRSKRPVRKVVFEIESHDQGWASDMDGGTWTWFTARIEQIPSPSPPASDGDGTDGDEDAATEHRQPPADEASDDIRSNEIEIVRNPLASKQWVKHYVEMTAEDSDWVASLAVGDWITVQACAVFSGWRNHVKNVAVTVYTAAVV